MNKEIKFIKEQLEDILKYVLQMTPYKLKEFNINQCKRETTDDKYVISIFIER